MILEFFKGYAFSIFSIFEKNLVRMMAPSEALYLEVPIEEAPDQGITPQEYGDGNQVNTLDVDIAQSTYTGLFAEPLFIAVGIFLVLIAVFLIFLKLRK